MSVTERSLEMLQDCVALELPAITAPLDTLEQRFNQVEKRFDSLNRRFGGVDRRSGKRRDLVMAVTRQVIDLSSIHPRPACLQSKETAHL